MNELNHPKNRRILIIDDNRAIHDDFRKILAPSTAAVTTFDATEAEVFGKPKHIAHKIRCEIDSAYQGRDGVELVKKALEEGRPYAMAFVDVRMPPGWDGVETTQKIWEVDPDVQIVLCTAYADYSWEEMFEKIGNCDGLVILKKPFEIVEALQLTQALTEKWRLHQQSRKKMKELESMVAERTAELQVMNHTLEMEVAEHTRAEEDLRWKTAFLEAQVDSSSDGILVVNAHGKKTLQNQKVSDLFKIPQSIADDKDDEKQRLWVAGTTKDQQQFIQRVVHLNSHPDEISRDELELKDGTILDRYSSPVVGKDGKYYGRIWTFRDITARKQTENALRESDEKFHQLADNITDAFWIRSPDLHKVHYVSPAFERIWGRSVNTLYANPQQWEDFILAEDRERVVAAFAALAGDAPSLDIEYRIVRPDDEVRWIHVRGFQVRDDAKKLIRHTGIVTDITERKRSEEAFRESQERFSGAFEFAPIGVALVAPNGLWLKVNKALCDLVGYSEGELLTRTFQDITHPADLEADLENVRRLIAGEIRSYQMEKRYIHAHGHFVTVLLNVSMVRDAQNQPLYFIAQIQDISERKRAEETVRLLGSAVQQSKESILITDAELDLPGPKILFVNPAFTKMTGYTAEEAIGKTPRILQGPRTDKAVLSRLRQNLKEGEAFEGEAINYRKGGQEFDLEWQIAPFREVGGNITHFVAIQRDITERKLLETRLLQSQKLETVGKLAGGIAHEFNSILTAIIGQSELLLVELPEGSPLTKNATEISRAATRAATLTRQLLAYGRKQILQPETLDLNVVLASMEGVFRHLMGGDVQIQIVPFPGLKAVTADAGQIEQVIMNLAMNARDAMPNGGKLTLETANISFDSESIGRYPELKTGDYVMLAVTDTGAGISEAVKARVFEPFFSTKGVGGGTGLGLSTCYGIIKQSGGHISVYSEAGRGATFKIYLPQVETAAKAPMPRLTSLDLPRGTETILLVEDDPALREMAGTLLKRLGYTVWVAANGIEALSLKQQRGIGHIDLLFTDVVMPHMSGKELADRVRALFPHTRILFTSAYTENAIVHQGVLDKGVTLLQKPFTPSALAHKLRQVLDQPSAPKPDSTQEAFSFARGPT